MRCRISVVAASAMVAFLALGAASAQATVVSASTIGVGINETGAVTDQQLVLTVSEDGGGTHQATVRDTAGQAVTPGTNCVQGATANEVNCTHPTVGGKFSRANVALLGGNDSFNATTVDDFGITVSAGVGDDVITGTATDASTAVPGAFVVDNLSGEGGNDVIRSRAGDDTLDGGPENDVLVPSSSGAQQLGGGTGTDLASYAAYTTGVTLVVGGGPVSGSTTGSEDTGIVRPKDQINADVEGLESGSGVDTMVGDADGETFDPGTNLDTVEGNDGVDVVSYEKRSAGVVATLGGVPAGGNEDAIAEVENLIGGRGGDTLTGDGGPNLIDGGEGDDALDGAGDDDLLIGRFGADDHVGGPGVDEASYSDRSDGVATAIGTAGASGNEDDGPAGSRDTIGADVERTVGGSDNDMLRGSPGDNELQGGGGADDLRGLGGDDTLVGGHGPDAMLGGGGRDLVSYAGRTRQLSITIGAPDVSGGREDGPTGARDTVAGDVEDLVAGAGADTLVGSAVANVLDGGQGGDSMQGLGGTDTVTYASRAPSASCTSTCLSAVNVTVGSPGASGSSFDGGSGNRDTIDLDIEAVLGGSFNDTLTGADGAQVLRGGPGADTLDGRDDADRMFGQGDFDTVTYGSRAGDIDATIGAAGASGNAADGPPGARDSIGADVEKLVGTISADTLQGTSNPDQLDGGPAGETGGDILRGLGGVDTLNGIGGDDTLEGGDDNDTLNGGLQDDTLDGGDGNDTLNGSDGDDTLEGGDGNDTLNAGLDSDTLDGGPGADVMNGSSSTAQGRPGDTVLYDSRTNPVNVVVGGGAVSGGPEDDSGGTKDSLTDIETVVGGDGGDTIQGGNIIATLIGGLGQDTLIGGSGGLGDLLDGGAGIDNLSGGAGIDTLLGGAEGDTLDGGDANDTVIGGEGNDVLDGGLQNDELDSGSGDDQLVGGLGSDFIDGGTGIDEASYADRATSGVTATIGDPGGSGNADDGAEGARDTIATDVERLLGGGGDDTLVGNSAANGINGADGEDTLRGGQGPDVLRGGLGNDELFSRDAFSDGLLCQGGAADRAEVDAADTAGADCETVVVG